MKKKVYVLYSNGIPFTLIKTTKNAYLYQCLQVSKKPTTGTKKKIRITVEEIK